MARAAANVNGKMNRIPLPLTFNRGTAKESTHQTGFNDTAWGNATRSYTKSACSLTNAKFDEIFQAAQPFINQKPKSARNKMNDATEVIEVDDDERACLVASDVECKLFFSFHS
jgi:hypothetical protein